MLPSIARRLRPLPSPALLAAAGALFVVAPLGGCTLGPGGGVSSDARRVPLEIDDKAFAELGYRREWQGFPRVISGGRLREFMVDPAREIVLARDSGSTVTLLEDSSGRQRWSRRLATELTRFVSLKTASFSDRGVCLASSESEVFVLDLDTGNLMDRQSYEKVVNAGPAVVGGGLLAYGTASGEVLVHNLNVRTKAWGHDLEGSIGRTPIIVNGALGAVASRGEVVFLEARTGNLWSRFSIFDGIATDPISTDDGLMVVAGLDQSLWAFDPPSGRVAWRQRTSTPLRTQPTHHDGVVYCDIPERGLTAFDAGSGQQQWTNEEVRGTVIGVSDGDLLVWNGTHMASVSPRNGSVSTRVELPTVAAIKTDAFVDGNLYIRDNAGAIAKLVPTY